VLAHRIGELSRACGVLKPVRPFLWKRPQQEMQVVGLASEERFQKQLRLGRRWVADSPGAHESTSMPTARAMAWVMASGLEVSARLTSSACDSNGDVDVSFVVAADGVFLWRGLFQQPEGVFEFRYGLKPPTRQPTPIAHHESVWADRPTHQPFGQDRGKLLAGHRAPPLVASSGPAGTEVLARRSR
jgi:hypothetical protein